MNKLRTILLLTVSLCLNINSFAAKWTDTGNYDTSWYNDLSETFEISTPRQFAGLIYLCNNGKSFSGKTIEIVSDLDFSANDWEPISVFQGTIDGHFHKIVGLHINHKNSILGPNYFSFGFFSTLSGTLKNLELDISFIVYSDGYNTISVSGISSTNEGLIKDCIVHGTISALNTDNGVSLSYNNSAGPFACVNSGTIINCVNYADITSSPYYYNYHTQAYAGGIVAVNKGNIYNCINYGDVFSRVGWNSSSWKIGWDLDTYAYSGGIAGINSGNIANVLNNANVKVNIVRLGNMDGNNGSAGNITASNSGSIKFAYCCSSNIVEAPDIFNVGLTLTAKQIQNQTYDFTTLLNQNIEAISIEDLSYWGNAPSKDNNNPIIINGFVLQTKVTNAQQNVATFT